MKFKYIIILLVCASIQISSQAQEKEEIVQTLNTNIEDFWNEPDADFIVKSYPTNWKDATGVVIASKSILRFDKKTKNKLFSSAEKIVIYEQTRLKIALNDKDAINDYSEVYFRFRNKKDGFKAKIIKPDGKEETLDLSAAITVENESEVNQRFLGFWDRSNSKANGYFKLAVPNLQEGDILEYAYEHFNELPITGENYYEFEPVYYLCNRYYPVLIQKIEIQTDNKSYVNAKSINGAPEFKEITGNDFNTFKWEDKNRDAVKDTRWVNEYLTMPMVKFQIVYSKNNDNGLAFISNKGELKKSILAEELANKVRRLYNLMDSKVSYYLFFKTQSSIDALKYGAQELKEEIKKELKRLGTKEMGDEEYIKAVYYVMRHHFAVYERDLSSQYTAYLFIEFLEHHKIPVDLVITTNKNITSLDNLVFKEELVWLIKVNNKYIFNFSKNSNLYDVEASCADNDAYIIPLEKNAPAQKIKLPATVAENNIEIQNLKVTLNKNLQFEIEKETNYKGISKELNSNGILTYSNVYDNDYMNYNGEDAADKLSSAAQDNLFERRRKRDENYKEMKPKYMKMELDNVFDNVVSYNKFKILSDGRNYKKNELKYTESYVLADMYKKAGANILLPLNALFGKQNQVKQDEQVRDYDIDFFYPRTIKWNLIFTIPDGYISQGLNDLNYNVDNETGSFISSAKIEANTLIITAVKQYKQVNIKKEKWQSVLQFLDAGYNFSQKKILLRKNK